MSEVRTARDEELGLLFREARTHNGWLDRPVDDGLPRHLYELAKMGPTGINSQPLRLVFAKSAAAKDRLCPALPPQNLDKAMAAPVVVVAAYDSAFHEMMPKLFPARPELRDAMAARPPELLARQGLQSATLQTGYLILAARALGLDCGPMGGFDTAKVDAAFFPDGRWRSILLVNLGYGDHAKLHPRNPRLSFEDACRIE